MHPKTKLKLFLYLLILIFALINYNKIDSYVTKELDASEYVSVKRIVDGDTFETTSGDKVRMLGINTPEKKEKYSDLGRANLEKLILNKSVRLEYGSDKKDLYNRTLAYVFLEDVNVNLNQIENGYANAYFPSGKDRHFNSFLDAWKKCVEKNINFCESSTNKCAKCIELSEFDYENEIIELTNNCGFDCNLNSWTIKDEGRKKFTFPNYNLESNKNVQIIVGNFSNTENKLYWAGEKYVWTSTGDTMFLRDAEYKLVLWENY